MKLWSDSNVLDEKEESASLSEEKIEKARLRSEFEKTTLLENLVRSGSQE